MAILRIVLSIRIQISFIIIILKLGLSLVSIIYLICL